ncbi:hypothetical protein LA76x_3140 [Lysobacter antibioticus]|uniref:Uncharacterized protein n=1 Tax=Lysobacter antibioticus TaxID=84531 RepID=A0A0S2FCN3_LYSAN|nr:hypothetical protein LA76x_3140 [Lysobacter antibioticus]
MDCGLDRRPSEHHSFKASFIDRAGATRATARASLDPSDFANVD